MAMTDENIFFVCLMGSGKAMIGKLLALKLKKKFYVTDQEIEKKSGVKISIIFELEGEEGFRKREAQIVDELTEKNIVLATGGSVVKHAENCALPKSRGKVIYLHAKPDNLAKRMKHDKVRPFLQQGNRLDTLNH